MKTFIFLWASLLAVSGSPFAFRFGTSQDVAHHSNHGYGWSSSGYHYTQAEQHAPVHTYVTAKPSQTPSTMGNVSEQAHLIPSGHPGSVQVPGDATPGHAHGTATPNTTVVPPVHTQTPTTGILPEHKPASEVSAHEQPNNAAQQIPPQPHLPSGTNFTAAQAQTAANGHPGARTDMSDRASASFISAALGPLQGHQGISDHRMFDHIDAYMKAIQDHVEAHEKAHNGKADASAHFRATKKAAQEHASAVHAIASAHQRVHSMVSRSHVAHATVQNANVLANTTIPYYQRL